MLSCKEASRLMSEAQDRKLSLGQRLSLRTHLLICRGCANYQRQLGFLRLSLRRYTAGQGADQDGNRP